MKESPKDKKEHIQIAEGFYKLEATKALTTLQHLYAGTIREMNVASNSFKEVVEDLGPYSAFVDPELAVKLVSGRQ